MPSPENPNLAPQDPENPESQIPSYESFDGNAEHGQFDPEAGGAPEGLDDETVNNSFNTVPTTEPINEEKLNSFFLEIMRSAEQREAYKQYDKNAESARSRAPIDPETGEPDIKATPDRHDTYWHGVKNPGQLDRLANKLVDMLHANPAYAARIEAAVAVKHAHAFGTPETATKDATQGSSHAAEKARRGHADATSAAEKVAAKPLPERMGDPLEKPVKPEAPEAGSSPTSWANYKRKLEAYEKADKTYRENLKRYENPTHRVNKLLEEAEPKNRIQEAAIERVRPGVKALSKVFGRSGRRDEKLRSARGEAMANNNVIDYHPTELSRMQRKEHVAGAEAGRRERMAEGDILHAESLQQVLERARQIASDPNYLLNKPDADGEPYGNPEQRHTRNMDRLASVFSESYLTPYANGEDPSEAMYPQAARDEADIELKKSLQLLKRINRGLEIVEGHGSKYENLRQLRSNILTNYVRQRYAHEQMRIGASGMKAEAGSYNADVDTSIDARMMDDQGIQVLQKRTIKTFYPDGSFALTDRFGNTTYRTYADGNLWYPDAEPDTDSAGEADDDRIEDLETEALEIRQSMAINAWFRNQTKELAETAHKYTSELAERYHDYTGKFDSGILKVKANTLEYWSDYLYAAYDPDEDAQLAYDGSVEELDEVDGAVAYTTLRPDGSSFVRAQDADGKWVVTHRYDRFGAEIPKKSA